MYVYRQMVLLMSASLQYGMHALLLLLQTMMMMMMQCMVVKNEALSTQHRYAINVFPPR